MNLKSAFLSTALCLSLAPSAFAADLRVKQPVYTKAPAATALYNWSGLYLVGYGDYGVNFTGANTTLATGSIDLNQIPHGLGIGGGFDALFQAQGSSWVLGFAADIGFMNLQSTANATTLNARGIAGSLSLSNATNYLGSFDAVLGYALGSDGRLLIGLKGGMGFGGEKPNMAAAGNCVLAGMCSQAANDTSVGYNIGGFAQYAIPNTSLSLFMEGDYSHLGDRSLTIGGGASGIGLMTSDVKFDIIKQEVGFKWNIIPAQ